MNIHGASFTSKRAEWAVMILDLSRIRINVDKQTDGQTYK